MIGSVSLFFFLNFFDTGRALFLKMSFNIFGEKRSWQPCAFLNNKINTETKAKCPEKHNYGINIFSNVMYLKLYRQKNLICLMISSLMISRFVSFSFIGDNVHKDFHSEKADYKFFFVRSSKYTYLTMVPYLNLSYS